MYKEGAVFITSTSSTWETSFFFFSFFRTATKKEILRSYRKLAVQWHPDHYEGDDKKKAEKMFIDIAAAKEVLSDPGKKSYFASSFALKK